MWVRVRGQPPECEGSEVCIAVVVSLDRIVLKGGTQADIKAAVAGVTALGLVSEPGLYRLMHTSRKPAAKQFTRWVAHDVLPAIRRTGRYEVGFE